MCRTHQRHPRSSGRLKEKVKTARSDSELNAARELTTMFRSQSHMVIGKERLTSANTSPGVGWCRGVNRYVDGWEGFPQMEINVEFKC